MAGRDGRTELELFLDDAPSTRALKNVDKALVDVGKRTSDVAKAFDRDVTGSVQRVSSAVHGATTAWNEFSTVQARSSQRLKNELAAHVEQMQTYQRALAQRTADVQRISVGSRISGIAEQAAGGVGSFALGFVGGGVAGASQLAISKALDFAQESVQAYRDAASAQLSLASAAKRANVSLAEQEALARRISAQYGLTTGEAKSAVGTALTVASKYGNTADAENLLRQAINASLGAGQRAGYAPEVLQAVLSGSDEQLNRLGLPNPQQIYQARARELGVKDLTSEQQAEAIALALKKLGLQNADIAAAAASGPAARYDRQLARLEDFKASVGGAMLNAFFEGVDGFSKAFAKGNENFTLAGRGLVELLPKTFFNDLPGFRNPFAGPSSALDGATAAALTRSRGYLAGAGASASLGVSPLFQQQLLALRAAGTEDPLEQIRTKFAALRLQLQEQFKGNSLLKAMLGFSDQSEQLELDRATRDITRSLRNQLDGLRSQYEGDGNPLRRIFLQGEAAAVQLREQLAKLGPEFAAQARLIQAEAGKLRDLDFARGVQASVLGASALGARSRELAGRVSSTGFGRGFYGQLTQDETFRVDYSPESQAERIRRVLGDANDVGDLVAKSLAGSTATTGDDREKVIARLRRDTILQGLAGISPQAFAGLPYERNVYQQALTDAREQAIGDQAQAIADKIAADEEKTNPNSVTNQRQHLIDSLLASAAAFPLETLKTAIGKLADGVAVAVLVRSDTTLDVTAPDQTATGLLTGATGSIR